MLEKLPGQIPPCSPKFCSSQIHITTMEVYKAIMAWHGMAWHGMAWHGMAWHGMARKRDLV